MLSLVLTASLAVAAGANPVSIDLEAPVVRDLDLLPERGVWPCAMTLGVDGTGGVTAVKVDRSCPSGLVATAEDTGRAFRFDPSPEARSIEVEAVFAVLERAGAEPKAESTGARVVYFLRPFDVTPLAPDAAFSAPLVAKVPASARGIAAARGTCLVRASMDTEKRKVGSAIVVRCADVLAAPALALVQKATLAKGQELSGEVTVRVVFEEPEKGPKKP